MRKSNTIYTKKTIKISKNKNSKRKTFGALSKGFSRSPFKNQRKNGRFVAQRYGLGLLICAAKRMRLKKFLDMISIGLHMCTTICYKKSIKSVFFVVILSLGYNNKEWKNNE
jgi:hypothetical protein